MRGAEIKASDESSVEGYNFAKNVSATKSLGNLDSNNSSDLL